MVPPLTSAVKSVGCSLVKEIGVCNVIRTGWTVLEDEWLFLIFILEQLLIFFLFGLPVAVVTRARSDTHSHAEEAAVTHLAFFLPLLEPACLPKCSSSMAANWGSRWRCEARQLLPTDKLNSTAGLTLRSIKCWKSSVWPSR